MTTKPRIGLLAALAILPAALLLATPASAQRVYVERHHGYGPGPWGGYHYGPGIVYRDPYAYHGPRARSHRHDWRRYPPGYARSGAVTFGSFACERDPAYRMDPRCYTR